MPDTKTDPDLRERYIVEAKFYRAFCHFFMHRLWGTFPPVTELFLSIKEELQLEKSSIQDNWTLVEQDLDDARTN